MVTRIAALLIFTLATALHLGAQVRVTTTDLLYIKQRMQIGTDTSLNFTSIVDTITAASTHHQAPSALAVYEAIGVGGGGSISDGDKSDVDVLSIGTVWTVDTSAITTIKIAANAVDSTKIATGGVSVTDLGAHGASSGQVLKWNGTQWAPAADSGGGSQSLSIDSTLLTSLERFGVSISGGNTVNFDVPRATLDTFSLSGTTLSASVSTDVFPTYTVSFSGWDTDASNDHTGSGAATQVATWSGAGSLTGSNTLAYETNTLSMYPSANDTLLAVHGTGSIIFGLRSFTDPYNGAVNAYDFGGLTDDSRVFLRGYGIYPKAPFYQEQTAGIGFRGTTGDLLLHTNGDHYTATLAGDNGTTNRNVSFYFVSGGATTGFGNPVIFQNIFSNNDSTANGFEYISRNTASGGVTIADSALMRFTSWDRGIQFNLTQAGNLGLKMRQPLYSLDVNATDGIRIPRGNTAQRPAGTPAGVVRFNTDSTAVEVGTGSTWTTFGSGGGGADDWGAQVVEHDATLTGDGIIGDLLGVASASLDSTHIKNGGVSVLDLGQHGASTNNVLKWNGTQWAPGAVNVTNEVTGRLAFANLTQGASLSVLGVPGSSSADMESIQAGTDHQVLRRSGTALGFGALNLASSNAVTGLLPVANLAAGAFVDGGNTLGTTATMGTNDANDLVIETNNTEVIRVTSAGYVGIGTTPGTIKMAVSVTNTGTSGTPVAAQIKQTLSPGSNSSAAARSLNMSNYLDAAGFNFTGSPNNASWFENRVINAGDITALSAINANGLLMGSDAATIGTVTNAYGGIFSGVTSFSNSIGGTVTNTRGIQIQNATKASLTLTNQVGLNVSALSAGTNNTALLLGTNTIPSGNFGLYSTVTDDSYHAGQLGLGVTSATAVLHLKAGTSSANTAPLKFTSGTNLTTAEAGSMEYDGTELYFSPSTTRQKLVRSLNGSGTLNFGSTTAGTSADLTITVTGAADGDPVILGVPNGSTLSNGCFTAWVSATNTVTVRFTNNDLTNALDPASGTFKVTVQK